ncbi:amidohydrolase family protein [Mycoplasmopsis agassizii]|uniref:Amidohydrolase-related domain-containing protein n=1 Tax=Mycoplasmopsis agassizii TaxID=33922 RepID=A0ABX4H4Q3_9BACT|nr:amidohydrolase family protein [Mycoplasmopsis agassizii]PAF54871.1 hypothetical protein CJF60_04000 [Mycoplasmopsis agassizii]SMC20044.1 N-acetylglucosamine-6-phosphate deacetylase [Mycoplasmopsis agassizii]
MNKRVLKNILLANHDSEKIVDITIIDNKIVEITNSKINDFELVMMPPFIDAHTHGGYGFSFENFYDLNNYEQLKKDYLEYRNKVYQEGVARVVFSSVVADLKSLENSFINFMKLRKDISDQFNLAWHFEGPFISKTKKGAHDESLIIPADFDFLNKIKELKQNLKVVFTIAAEDSQNMSAIVKHNKDFIFSLGHSTVNEETAKLAIKNGAKKVTHFFNAMNGYHHSTNKSLVNLILENEHNSLGKTNVEIITDGIHIDDTVLRFIYKNVNIDNLSIVSDSLVAKGLENGNYELGTLKVKKIDGVFYLDDLSSLAGSANKYNDLLRHFKNATSCSWSELVKLSSYNQKDVFDLDLKDVEINENQLNNFVLVDKDLNVDELWSKGELLYKK